MKNNIFILLSLLLLGFIIISGFFFRLNGIQNNHSFWSDEALVASFARDITQGKESLIQSFNPSNYQYFYKLLLALTFTIFGISEFSARLPSVIFGTLGILFSYLIAKKLSDESGGLLAAFLFSFSQLNLANSTQAKPYTIIQTLFLITIYLLLISQDKHYSKNPIIHIVIIALLTTTTMLHSIGIFFWIIYAVYIFSEYRINLTIWIRKPITLVCFIIGLAIFIILFRIDLMIKNLFVLSAGRFIIANNISYLRELLWKNYGFIILPSIFGLFTTFKKKPSLTIAIGCWIFVILFMWNFLLISHNIRYLVPLFGIIFTFFGVFWAHVGDKLLYKKSWLACLIVATFIFIGGNKIVRKPANYYTPNADLYGDVQIADYKTTYKKIKQTFPNLDKIVLFNDLIDTERWYLDKQASAYFIKRFGNDKPTRHPINGKPVYKTLSDFLAEKLKYRQGILIVEDWESMLPEDIKQYAKKNLKSEIRVEGLPQANGDNWPLEVYSWGM